MNRSGTEHAIRAIDKVTDILLRFAYRAEGAFLSCLWGSNRGLALEGESLDLRRLLDS